MQENILKILVNKKSVCIGFTLFLFAVAGVGCDTSSPSSEQGSHIKIQSGQSSAEMSWPE